MTAFVQCIIGVCLLSPLVRSGNPLIAREMSLQLKLNDLDSEKRRYNERIFEMQDNIRVGYPSKIGQNELIIKHLKSDYDMAMSAPKAVDEDGKECYPITIDGETHKTRKESGDAIKSVCLENMGKLMEGKEIPIGEYRGMQLTVFHDKFSDKTKACLKGEKPYYCDINLDSSVGIVIRLDNAISNIQKSIADLEARVDVMKTDLEKMKADVEKPFEREAELRAVIDELEDVHSKLTQYELTDDTLQKELFERLADNFPQIMTGDRTHIRCEPSGTCAMPLNVEMHGTILSVSENCKTVEGIEVNNPRMDFKVDYENKKVIPVRYDNNSEGIHQEYNVCGEIPPDIMKQINSALSFADDWFDIIEDKGYKPVGIDTDLNQNKENQSR